MTQEALNALRERAVNALADYNSALRGVLAVEPFDTAVGEGHVRQLEYGNNYFKPEDGE